jgi:hypothetical protein
VSHAFLIHSEACLWDSHLKVVHAFLSKNPQKIWRGALKGVAWVSGIPAFCETVFMLCPKCSPLHNPIALISHKDAKPRKKQQQRAEAVTHGLPKPETIKVGTIGFVADWPLVSAAKLHPKRLSAVGAPVK